MRPVTCDDLSQFVHVAGNFSRHDDLSAVSETLTRLWSVDRLTAFLRSDRDDAAALAAWALGLVGGWSECAALAALLAHRNPSVVTACEDALWSIWVRGAGPEQVARLHQAMQFGRDDAWDRALPVLGHLVETLPDYAEAQHQWAIAQHSLGNLAAAEGGYRRAAALNPYHYPAHCALGHIAVEQDQYQAALTEYEAALRIHPNLAELREIVPALSQALGKRIVA